jgi:hypothetical protein
LSLHFFSGGKIVFQSSFMLTAVPPFGGGFVKTFVEATD